MIDPTLRSTVKRLPFAFYTQGLFVALFALLTARFVWVGRAFPAACCLFGAGFGVAQAVAIFRSTRTFVRTRAFVARR